MDVLYLAALCAVPGLGRVKLPQLISRLGSAQAVYEASANQLLPTGLCRPEGIATFLAARKNDLPQKLDYFCRQQGVRLLSIYDEDYPQSLKEINDPPLVLYVKGNLPQTPYNMGIVGSRAASHYGIRAAEFFARAMAKENIPVISGGARGIDTAAHQGCLQEGGITVAVLGCGIDIAYPPDNEALFQRIAAKGAVISEYPPGTSPRPQNFPARNRIIVGLSRGIIVAEAARKSGALITAHIAADEGREVYCVPGNIFEGKSIGCHDLIRTGAKLVDGPQEIFEDVKNWYLAKQRQPLQPSIFDLPNAYPEPQPQPQLSQLGQQLYGLLEQGPLSLEDLTEQSGADLATISMELLNLQIEGYINQDVAQRYYRM